MTISALLVFALVNAGENQVWLALATVPVVVVLAAPLVYLASRGCGRAVSYAAFFLLLGALATGLLAGWIAYSIRAARSTHERDDLRGLGGALHLREATGREWQGSRPVEPTEEEAFLDRLLAPPREPPADSPPVDDSPPP